MAWVMAKRAPRRHPAAGDSPAGAALAAPSAEPGGATVAVIAARTGISMPAARLALLAHEKNGTAARIEGSRPGIADTWTPAAPPRRRVAAPPGRRAAGSASPSASVLVSRGRLGRSERAVKPLPLFISFE
jgi:hypothetical protein